MKRSDYISWDDYFMGVAMLSAKRSKDPNTQVGCCLVSPDNKIIGIGYNGFPKTISDDDLPWDRNGEYLDTKYPYVVHAEANAILNSTKSLIGARAYVTLFPCNECAKLLVQSGIKEVVFLLDFHHDDKETIASRRILDMSGVKYRKMEKKVIVLE
ncbi:MAG: dCMP deaminase family protein [Gammaproteobacteria bacterium]|nr:dCMP deaminase family protein [Gammaproteobacteria bacterium]